MAGLTVVSENEDVAVAVAGAALVCHFRHKTPVSCIDAVRRAGAMLPPKNAVFFAVIETTSVPPDGETRRAFAAFFDAHAAQLRCIVVAIRGDGFRTAMVRAIVAGVVFIMPGLRVVATKHIVSSPEEGARLAAETVPGLDSVALRAACAELGIALD